MKELVSERVQMSVHCLVQESMTVFFKWMSTSGNEFEKKKMVVLCENLILKKILFHNAEISKMASKMAANFEISISNKTL